MNILNKRVMKEILNFNEDYKDKQNFDLNLINDCDFTNLKATMPGPKDSIYEKGIFCLNILLEETYPFTPPLVKFITKIWHPNISSNTGYVCLNILNVDWRPVLRLEAVILSIQQLLISPDTDSPQDSIVSNQMIYKPTLYEKTVKYWIFIYATGPVSYIEKDFEIKIEKLLKLYPDLDKEKACYLLSINDWDLLKTKEGFIK